MFVGFFVYSSAPRQTKNPRFCLSSRSYRPFFSKPPAFEVLVQNFETLAPQGFAGDGCLFCVGVSLGVGGDVNPKLSRDTLATMRVEIYFAVVAGLSGIARHYPFLFEPPLIAAIGGAYWAFFAEKAEKPGD